MNTTHDVWALVEEPKPVVSPELITRLDRTRAPFPDIRQAYLARTRSDGCVLLIGPRDAPPTPDFVRALMRTFGKTGSMPVETIHFFPPSELSHVEHHGVCVDQRTDA